MRLYPSIIVSFCLVPSVLSFGIFDSFKLGTFNNNNNNGAMKEKREELKRVLLEECQSNKGDRQRVEELVYDLAQVSPTPNSATSPLLRQTWLLEWTTEKEINFFIDWKISSEVTQIIDKDAAVLSNCIEFTRGGFLGVTGALSTNGGIRTDFEFTEATLDLGNWGSFKIPPIGKGWFDTLYLDEELRVDTNSRNDILICTVKQQP